MSYQKPTSTRREHRTLAGRFRGGKLTPVLAHAFRESESGLLSQSFMVDLDPVAGRMISPVTATVFCVYVPTQALYALKYPEQDYAGNTEIVRDKLLSGAPLFDLEGEGEISKRLGIVPRSIDGTKMVNEVIRLGHNSAVNFLRRRKYVNAAQLDATSTAITPALLGQTVLDRLNGVLDPEDRVNGAVNLQMGNMRLPVEGLAVHNQSYNTAGPIFTDQGESSVTDKYSATTSNVRVRENPDNPGFPLAEALFSGGSAGSISLTDFYEAELQDRLTRRMRQIVDDNPEHGEEIVQRWAHGLSVDTGRQPFVLYEREVTFNGDLRRAMDGANLDVEQTDLGLNVGFTVPVPATELGGVVMTFIQVKPDETLAAQPHPFLTEPWAKINYVSDELSRDPVAVRIRELDADCDQADEGTIAFYVGHNHLKKAYVNYGFNRHVDPTTVESKTALWQLEIPMSVTPENILYPEDLPHYPFQDQLAEVAMYQAVSSVTVQTPLVFGPTPVEELAAIEDLDVFDDAE